MYGAVLTNSVDGVSVGKASLGETVICTDGSLLGDELAVIGDVGMPVGDERERSVGSTDGKRVGCSIARAVGAAVGCDDGLCDVNMLMLGVSVGGIIGDSDGRPVGSRDVEAVGSPNSRNEGERVGALVAR